MGLFSSKKKAKDPVCGMDVDVKHAPGGTIKHEGTQYAFCCPECHDKFAANPWQYAGSDRQTLTTTHRV